MNTVNVQSEAIERLWKDIETYIGVKVDQRLKTHLPLSGFVTRGLVREILETDEFSFKRAPNVGKKTVNVLSDLKQQILKKGENTLYFRRYVARITKDHSLVQEYVFIPIGTDVDDPEFPTLGDVFDELKTLNGENWGNFEQLTIDAVISCRGELREYFELGRNSQIPMTM